MPSFPDVDEDDPDPRILEQDTFKYRYRNVLAEVPWKVGKQERNIDLEIVSAFPSVRMSMPFRNRTGLHLLFI